MPESKVPAASAAAVPPVATPPPSAPAIPTAPAPSVTKPSIRPPASTRPAPKTLSAKKALNLDETPAASIKKVVEKTRKDISASTPTTATYVPPAEPAPASDAPAASPVTPPPEPAPTTTPAATPVPAAPEKIKIGDKEYTREELEAALKPAQAPAPAAQPPTPAPQPTAEEIAEREKSFIDETAGALELPMTEAEMDTLLAGGKEAVELMATMRKRDMATAIMHARKGVAGAINPILEKLFGVIQPLVNEHQSLQRYTVEQKFINKHKDFVPHKATVTAVAEELVRLYPQQVGKMSEEQFIDEVARQSDIILTSEHKRWFPDGNGNWRVAAAAAPAAPAAPAASAAPATTPPPVPATPPAPRPPAPAATPPAGAMQGGKNSWTKSVAGSLRG